MLLLINLVIRYPVEGKKWKRRQWLTLQYSKEEQTTSLFTSHNILANYLDVHSQMQSVVLLLGAESDIK